MWGWSQQVFVFADVCSLIFPNVFALSPLYCVSVHPHPPATSHLNENLRPLELQIYLCRIFGVSLISNLMYLYVFAFLLLLPSVLFSLDYNSKTFSFSPII